jgi:hypothetical protein
MPHAVTLNDPCARSIGTVATVIHPVDDQPYHSRPFFEATAESDLRITGYVIYVDGNNVYRNFSPSLDAWVVLPSGGTHLLGDHNLGFQWPSIQYCDLFDLLDGQCSARPSHQSDAHGEHRQAFVVFLDRGQ